MNETIPTPRTEEALIKTQGLFRASAETNGFSDLARQLERELVELRSEHEALKRGEFICRKCGLRKDADASKEADF